MAWGVYVGQRVVIYRDTPVPHHWGSFLCHSLHRMNESRLVTYFSFSSI